MVGECFDVAPPGLGQLIMLISGGLHPRLHDVAAPRLEERKIKTRKRGKVATVPRWRVGLVGPAKFLKETIQRI